MKPSTELGSEIAKRRASKRIAEIRAEAAECRARQLKLVGNDKLLLSWMLQKFPVLTEGGLG